VVRYNRANTASSTFFFINFYFHEARKPGMLASANWRSSSFSEPQSLSWADVPWFTSDGLLASLVCLEEENEK
jgi:hypothetical protein